MWTNFALQPHIQFMLGVCTWPNWLVSIGDRPEVEKRFRENSLEMSEFFTDTEDALNKRIAGRRRTDLTRVFIV